MLPAMAMAHPGHSLFGFDGGLLHPLSGMNHLAALGLCAALILAGISLLIGSRHYVSKMPMRIFGSVTLLLGAALMTSVIA